MLPPESVRQRLAGTLNAAYAEGVLSQSTLVHRLELLFAAPLVDPARLVGDLPARTSDRAPTTVITRIKATFRKLRGYFSGDDDSRSVLLALDWQGGREELLIGRNPTCDVVLSGAAVSRHHARLKFRDGAWVIQDLGSTNGTIVNGIEVGRCRLWPGDRLMIGDEHLLVD